MKGLTKTRLFSSILFLFIGILSVSAISNLLSPDPAPDTLLESVSLSNIPDDAIYSDVLGEKDENPIFFTVNVPARFKKDLTAPNIVYSITGGEGIEVTEGQYPTVSNAGVLSLQDQTGDLYLTGGSGISVNGLEVSNALSFVGSGGTTVGKVGNIVTVSSSAPDYSLSGWSKVGTSVGLTTATDSVAVDVITFGNATITNGKSIRPDTDLGSDLGSASLRFNNLYVGNINSNSSTSTAGQATFTYEALNTALTEASVLINPTAPVANGQLLGLSVAGYQRAMIDEDGDLTLGYNDAISTPASDYPLSVYGHNGTQVSFIDTTGGAYFAGKVGIGTSPSSYGLDVSGTIRGGGQFETASANLYIISNYSYLQGDIIHFRNKAGTVESMTIDINGNVGIGTTTPDTALSVVGYMSVSDTASVAQGRIYFGRDDYGYGGILPQYIRGNSGHWYFSGLAGEELHMDLNAGSISSLRFSQGDVIFDASQAGKSLKLQTQGVDRVIVDSDGQVGIGVADPLFGIDLGTAQNDTSSIRGYAFKIGVVASDTHIGQLKYLYGNGGVGRIDFYTDQTSLSLSTYEGVAMRNIIQIGSQQAASKAYNHIAQPNPTLIIHSQTTAGTATDEWISFAHDQTNGVITTGSGDLILSPAENVGIGTTDPREKLEVNGNIRLPANASIYGEANGAGLSISNAAVLTIRRETSAYYASNSAFIGFQFRGATNQSKSILDILKPTGLTGDYFSISDATEGDILTVDSSGQVGIGTNTPSQALDIVGNLHFSNSGYPTITSPQGLTIDPGYASKILMTNGIQLFTDSNGVFPGTDNTMPFGASSWRWHNITIGTGDSSFGGNVGIGTDTPGYKLDVHSGIDDTAAQFISTDGNVEIRMQDSVGISFIENNAGRMAIRTSNGAVRSLYLGNSGEVGLGGDMDAIGNLTGAALIIDSSDNVGIGDTTPSYSLDITGMMRATEGVVTYTKAGTISDVDFTETPIDGLMGVDSTNGRLYFRHGGAWHYVAQTAGFQIPEYETYTYDFNTSSFDNSSPLADGDFLIPFVEGRMSDGAIHGLYTSFNDVKDQLFANELSRILSLEQRVTALEAAGLTTNPLLSSTGSIGTVAGWSDTQWTFLGDTRFNGEISVNQDTAGTVTVPTGSTTITHSFSSAFTKTPVIYLTPVDSIEGNYHLQQVSPTTFIVELSQPQLGNISFNWLAVINN